LVQNHRAGGDFETFRRSSLEVLGIDPKMDPIDFQEGNEEELADRTLEQFQEFYDRKAGQISGALMPQMQHVYENQREQYKRIQFLFSDGRLRPLIVTADIEDAISSKGKSIIRDIEKTVTLAIIDEKWKEHLRSMDELKESVQAASFEQKDPLVVYKMEAFNLFEDLVYTINEEVAAYLSKGTLVLPDGRTLEQARERKTDSSKYKTNKTGDGARAAAEAVSRKSRAKPSTFKRDDKKVGRNDPCPCGSGKKYKQCHGKKGSN